MRTPITPRQTITSACEDVENLELSRVVGGNVKRSSPFLWRTVPQKVQHMTQKFHPEVYNQEKRKHMSTYVQKEMFTAARRVTANGYRVSFWGDENILELHSGDSGKILEDTKKAL